MTTASATARRGRGGGEGGGLSLQEDKIVHTRVGVFCVDDTRF